MSYSQLNTQLKNILPPLYAGLLSPAILSLSATETKATCDNCLRSRDKRFSYSYRRDLKCCTFHPFTPNYAVGAILSELSTPQIEAKIKNKQFALPIGIMAPFSYQFKFLNKEESDFGNREDLLCPYYLKTENKCSIWLHRGVVCTSFYCRSDAGQDGQKFWAVFSEYLSYIEMALAEECLVQLDFSPRDISDQLMYLNKREFEASEVEQDILPDKEDLLIWNAYHDKYAFYKKCYEIVKNMDKKHFKEVLGNQGAELEYEVKDYAHRRKN